jgi:short chain dehydrogenase
VQQAPQPAHQVVAALQPPGPLRRMRTEHSTEARGHGPSLEGRFEGHRPGRDCLEGLRCVRARRWAYQGLVMSLAPRRAIVTASNSGIGRATAVALAVSGMDVGITWHTDRTGADATAAEVRGHGQAAVVARLDTAAFERYREVIDRLADRLGGVEVFVNNAGTGSNTPALEMSLDELSRCAVRMRTPGPNQISVG